MKKTVKTNKFFQGSLFFFLFMAIASQALAENPGQNKGERLSNDSTYLSIASVGIPVRGRSHFSTNGNSGMFKSSAALKANMATQVQENVVPDFGQKLREITEMILEYIVIQESSTKNEQAGFSNDDPAKAEYPDGKTDLGLALTSAFINGQLSDGMQLEFHANPLAGGGAIMLKKIF